MCLLIRSKYTSNKVEFSTKNNNKDINNIISKANLNFYYIAYIISLYNYIFTSSKSYKKYYNYKIVYITISLPFSII